MKISEMLVELQRMLEEYGDVDCYAYSSDSGYHQVPDVAFREEWVLLWDNESSGRVTKKVKAVVIAT